MDAETIILRDQPADGDGALAGDAARVESDGLALVHEGEWIMPAPGAAAGLAPVSTAAAIDVPIEVVVTVSISPEERESIIQETLRRLRMAVEGAGDEI